jgi:ABC-type transport system involved in cytochrome bd biosynthesis fused ATPase/permease subunit
MLLGSPMTFDIAQAKAWMADHLFLTVGAAVVLTVIAMFVARDALKHFYLRLFQLASLCGLAVGLTAITTGLRGSDQTVLTIGGAAIGVVLVSYYAGMRMRQEREAHLKSARNDLATKDAELRQAKEQTSIRLVVEPPKAKS